MKQTIEKIVDVSRRLRITCNQALFLLAYQNGVYTVDIPGEELLELVKKGFMKGNRVTQEAMERLDAALTDVKQVEIERTLVNAQYPILTKDTGQLTKRLATHFLGDRLTGKEFERLLAYEKNPIAVPFLFIFLEMFPTSNSKKNAAWNKHFETKWGSSVTLRKMSAGTARKFKKIWKKKDIGLFLLGTYLHVKESYNEDAEKYYCKSIENYLAEWEHWYNMAEDMLESGKLTEFTRREVKRSTNTNVI